MEPVERKLEYKEQQTHTRAEIATRLRAVASEIELGAITEGDMHVDLPDIARLEIDVKTNRLGIQMDWGRPKL
jgi:Amphi-Trp domain